MADASRIRNFCIIAHIDHGKSTLADRLLELTGTVEKRQMREQMLDSMDIERERGITIKLAPVRMRYRSASRHPERSEGSPTNVGQRAFARDPSTTLRSARDDKDGYILNLIDTPGHVDFTYEVSRSLAAVEGAVLLVDASQGVQAQTIGNLYLALEQNLTIIPVVNKIDLPNAEIEKTKAELVHLLGCKAEEILCVSGKTGEGVEELLQAVVERVPPPTNRHPERSEGSLANARGADKLRDSSASPQNDGGGGPLRALIFDSIYDKYRGVVAYVRVFDGGVKKGDKIAFMATKAQSEALEVGYFKPKLVTCDGLDAGEIGYIVTGLKDINGCRVGDTITLQNVMPAKLVLERHRGAGIQSGFPIKSGMAVLPLPGYKEVKPMVFAGIFPKVGDEYPALRDAIEKVKLNDGALYFEPEHSSALGFGFRCGFLGLLHLEIVEERLRREHGVEVITTVPSVAYRVTRTGGEEVTIKGAQELPDPSQIKSVEEPWVKVDVVSPKQYLGGIMQLVAEKRGVYVNTEYMTPSPQSPPIEGGESVGSPPPLVGGAGGGGESNRVILHYELPLSAILVDFYDRLKSASSGYASLNYEVTEYRPAEVVRLDILVADETVEALSTMVYRDEAQEAGKKIVEALKNVIPRGQFEIKLQAALGGKIVASERIKPFRKDVTAKLYGGDATRKMKLLEKQKRGKQRMMKQGGRSVDIPPEAYLAVLKR